MLYIFGSKTETLLQIIQNINNGTVAFEALQTQATMITSLDGVLYVIGQGQFPVGSNIKS